MRTPSNISESGPPTVVVAAGATIETALLPYHLVHLIRHTGLDVAACVTARALDFVTTCALRAITGRPVYTHKDRFHLASGTPSHIWLARASVLVVYPASARVLATCALGLISCPVSRLFAFTEKDRVIVAPTLHPAMEPRLYRAHLDTLASVGCAIVAPGGRSAWPQLEQLVVARTGCSWREAPEVAAIGADRRSTPSAA